MSDDSTNFVRVFVVFVVALILPFVSPLDAAIQLLIEQAINSPGINPLAALLLRLVPWAISVSESVGLLVLLSKFFKLV
ncbi:MAG: hypothetical protein HY917_04010 [Candidatus Diapherotrites archaeon]|nr:hypothetical protein [Candidatus Diapherotrites archaeon]